MTQGRVRDSKKPCYDFVVNQQFARKFYMSLKKSFDNPRFTLS